MFTEIANYTAPLTQALAEEYSSTLAWPGDRSLGPSHLKWLKNEYDAGRFYGPSWAKALLNGKWYRVDGKHSSTMLTQLDGQFPKNMKVNVKEFRCDTEADLVALYASFDSRESARDGRDYAKATLACHGAFCDGDKLSDTAPSPTAAFRLASGISIYLNPEKRAQMKPRDRSLLINEDPEFIGKAAPFVTRHMGIVSACAAMYATWVANRAMWPEFWGAVLNETETNPQSPTRVLARYLASLTKGPVGSRPKADVRCIYVKCLHAWNAWRTGDGTVLSYYVNKPIPFVRR